MSTGFAFQEQHNQASATPELMNFLRKLTTPKAVSLSPSPTSAKASSAKASIPNELSMGTGVGAGTWQDRWIHDHRVDEVAERLGPSTPSPPLASLVFHPRVPAVKMVRANGRWELPPVAASITNRPMVGVNSGVYQATVNPSPVIPQNASTTADTWVLIGSTCAWGLPIAASAEEVLIALGESPVVPSWQSRYAVVPQSELAKRVVLGPYTGKYEDWELAKVAAKEMQEEGYVVELVEDVQTGEVDALDFIGANFPSIRRPMIRAGLTPK